VRGAGEAKPLLTGAGAEPRPSSSQLPITVQRLNGLVQGQGQGGAGHHAGDYFDIRATVVSFGLVHGGVEFPVGGDPGGEPVFEAQGLGELGVVPGWQVVVADARVLAEQAFDEVALVIEAKDDGFEAEPVELADFLDGHLVGAFAGDEDDSAFGMGQCHAEGCRSGPTDGAPERLIEENGA